jgi:hypothetical protein
MTLANALTDQNTTFMVSCNISLTIHLHMHNDAQIA